ncbi:hypothetical protein [Janibacter alittae]|uniref:ARB-07466-like C-terminal domain-containing protein n=1 Tax=Janibacter alittae TaxID=3115209 RepID=A0ABZ2MJZ5_9MICO
MISSRYVGRHGRSRARICLPAIGGSGAARAAAKSVAGMGIVLGSGAFVIAPSSAVGTVDVDPSVLGAERAISATDLLADRDAGSEESTAARSARRSAPAAITAPDGGPGQAGPGTLDVEPVAKPEPKPKPKPEPEPEPEAPSADTGATRADASTETDGPAAEPTPSGSSEPEAQESSTSASGGVQTDGYAAQASAIGLGPNASAVYSAVRNQFPDMTNIGGYRAGDPGDHGSGRAVDIMVSGARGDQVAAWLQQNAGSLNIKYVIWKQRIWRPGSSWSAMEDRGSATANHYDHVHVSVH